MIELSKAEFEVMQAIWAKHPARASEVIERLDDDKKWQDKTVKTFLGRLVKKGALSFERDGRQYIYSPMIEQENYTLKESKSFIERFFSGRVAPLVSGFAQSKELSQRDIDELKKVISDWEQNNPEADSDNSQDKATGIEPKDK